MAYFFDSEKILSEDFWSCDALNELKNLYIEGYREASSWARNNVTQENLNNPKFFDNFPGIKPKPPIFINRGFY